LVRADIDTSIFNEGRGQSPPHYRKESEGFGYGQGLVMVPLSGAVLSTVQARSAGSGSGLYGTTTQVSSAAGVAAIGSVDFAMAQGGSARAVLHLSIALIAVSIFACIVFMRWMRRAALVPM
jgi:hypothetical protein